MFLDDDFMDLILNNLKKVFFPEEWLALDMKFSKTELFAMLLLDKRKEITMTELAETIHVPMSTATGMIDRLARNSYVKRERTDEDRRVVVLCLTGKGVQVTTEFKTIISRYVSIVTDDLTEQEQQFLISIILKAVKKLETQWRADDSVTDVNREVRTIPIE